MPTINLPSSYGIKSKALLILDLFISTQRVAYRNTNCLFARLSARLFIYLVTVDLRERIACVRLTDTAVVFNEYTVLFQCFLQSLQRADNVCCRKFATLLSNRLLQSLNTCSHLHNTLMSMSSRNHTECSILLTDPAKRRGV